MLSGRGVVKVRTNVQATGADNHVHKLHADATALRSS